MADINLTVAEEIIQIITIEAKGDPGPSSHPFLTDRDAPDSHPQSAITGLVDALAGKEPTQTAASQVEAEEGTSIAIRSWSALRIWQAIRKAWQSITAQAWTVQALGVVGATLTMDASTYSEFSATLPASGTTTTISISNLPAIPSAWPVLHLVTGATFDAPLWSGIDASEIVLSASAAHTIGFQPVYQTSGWKIVAKLMHSEADA